MPPAYKRPVTPVERDRREQVNADKLAVLHDRLAEQVAALRTGQDWRRWLDVAARFHSYSFHNTLLIQAQRPEAAAVAGYQAWRTLGRQVDKGERGIQILAPVLHRPRPDDPPTAGTPAGRDGPDPPGPDTAGPDTVTPEDGGRGQRGRPAGYRVAYVWDVTRTSGQPLPAPPRPELLSGQAPQGLWDSLARVVGDRGFTVERGDCGQANGFTDYTTRTVRVRADVDDAQAVKTLAHETGHVLLHDPADLDGGAGWGTTVGCRGVREVEAESVAYLVAAVHGLPTGGYTFAYVTGWAADVDGAHPERVVRDTGQRVLTATRAVLAVTAPDTTPAVDSTLAARVTAGAQRTADVRAHAETTSALTQPSTARAATTAGGAEVEVLARLNMDAAAFYTSQLTADTPEAAAVRAVLTQRAVPPEAVATYQVGYARAGWTALTDHLHGRGYTDQELLAAGVGLSSRRGGVVDRFRDRIIFPVHDPAGERVIAFLGRALAPGEGTPKYLNSPETALYRKSDVLYGLGADPARAALAGGARPVLVEGALDAIAVTCAGAGRHVGVAPSGTALTAGQVDVLDTAAGPLAERGVTVAFDGDPAGQTATLRCFGLLRAAGAWPSVAVLPDGHDPASLTQQHGPQTLLAALDAAGPLADAAVDARLARWAGQLHWAEGQIGAARDAAKLIATFPAEHIGRQVVRVAEQLGLEPHTVTGAVADAVSRDDDTPAQPRKPDHRHNPHLDRGPAPASAPVTAAPTAAGLARVGYPSPLAHLATVHTPTGVAPEPGLALPPPARTPIRAAAGL